MFVDPQGLFPSIYSPPISIAIGGLILAPKFDEKLLNDIQQAVQQVSRHFTNTERVKELSVGVGISLAKSLLDAGVVSSLTFYEVLATFMQNESVYSKLYSDYNRDINELLIHITEDMAYPDSFYFGRSIGDVATIAIGVYGTANGIAKIVGGISVGATGSVAGVATAPVGGVALIGASLTAAGTLIGTGAIEVGVSQELTKIGTKNWKDDWNKFNYYDSISCGNENAIKHVYKSIKDSPNYPNGFKQAPNGKKQNNVTNGSLLEELRKIEPGEWKKIYQNGYDQYGDKISIHYFQHLKTGKVFDVKVQFAWS
jgi:hypothetical protein